MNFIETNVYVFQAGRTIYDPFSRTENWGLKTAAFARRVWNLKFPSKATIQLLLTRKF